MILHYESTFYDDFSTFVLFVHGLIDYNIYERATRPPSASWPGLRLICLNDVTDLLSSCVLCSNLRFSSAYRTNFSLNTHSQRKCFGCNIFFVFFLIFSQFDLSSELLPLLRRIGSQNMHKMVPCLGAERERFQNPGHGFILRYFSFVYSILFSCTRAIRNVRIM